MIDMLPLVQNLKGVFIMVKDEYTLVLVKPDGVKTRHIGDIISKIENKGYRIEALKMINPTKDKLRQHKSDRSHVVL